MRFTGAFSPIFSFPAAWREGEKYVKLKLMKKAAFRKRSMPSHMANGIVDVRGEFYRAHRDEIMHLIDLTVENVRSTHPFEGILSREEERDALVLEVTSAKLAERLGKMLNRVYGGHTEFAMMHDTGQARVFWERGTETGGEENGRKRFPPSRKSKRGKVKK